MKGDGRKTTLPPRLTIHNKSPMYAVYLAIYNKKNYLALSLISKTWFYNSMLPMIIHNQPFHPLQTGKKQPESSLKKLKQLLINKKASHQTEISIYII